MSKKWLLVFFTFLLSVSTIFTGCSSSNKSNLSKDNRQLHITTSFFPMYVATLNVTKGIDNVLVDNMTKPQSGCLHDYQLTTDDMKKLDKTDIFVVNGASMEAFLDKVIKQQKKMKVIDASKGIPLIKGKEGDNPHVWLSISREIEQVKNISEQLAGIDSKNADKYRSNAKEYIDKLAKLNEKMRKEIAALPNRSIVTFHEAFPYFAQEFDLRIVGVIEREPGTEPTPQELREVIEKVKNLPVKVLFTEPQYSPKAAEAIARETGAKIFVLDPVVTGEARPEAINDYVMRMENNLAVLKEALK